MSAPLTGIQHIGRAPDSGWRDCLEPLGLTVTEGARLLGVTRQALNNPVNGKSGISPEMAVRLSKAFGGTAASWLGVQLDHDLARVMRRADEIDVRRRIPRRCDHSKKSSSILLIYNVSSILHPTL